VFDLPPLFDLFSSLLANLVQWNDADDMM
jgi:hypothetical protein